MQIIAIFILAALAFLFIKYVLSDGNIADGAQRAAAGCSIWVVIVIFWITVPLLLLFLVLAAFGAFNH